MIASAIISLISLILGLVLHFKKSDFPILERVLKTICLLTFLSCIFIIGLKINEYQLKGKYSETILGLTFICSTFVLFGVTKNKWVKVLSGLITIPSLIFGLGSILFKALILFFYIPFVFFQAPMQRFQLNDNLFLDVKVGGFMACGESLTVNKSKNLILDQQYYIGNNLCVKGINNVETLYISNDSIRLLIYHTDLENYENPYIYATKWRKKNV